LPNLTKRLANSFGIIGKMAVNMAKSMLEPNELDDQDSSSVDDDQDDDQSDDEGGGAGDSVNTVKIGDKEYTLDQLAEFEKKASGYDALLPEFTQKSQKLAELEKASKTKDENLPSYKKEGWQPKDFSELSKALEEAEERGVQRALSTLEQRQAESLAQSQKVKQEVDDFVAEVKKTDKEFDDKDFFSYATKHKFPLKTTGDLRAVYSSYAEIQTLAGGLPRGSRKDKVNIPGGGDPKGPDLSDLRGKEGSILEKALDALDRFKK